MYKCVALNHARFINRAECKCTCKKTTLTIFDISTDLNITSKEINSRKKINTLLRICRTVNSAKICGKKSYLAR